MAASVIGTLLVVLLVSWWQGTELAWALAIAVLVPLVTLIGDLVQWRVNGARLREQGWEW